jgi:hypothetical protein
MDVCRPVRPRSGEISARFRILSWLYHSYEAVGIWKGMFNSSAVERIISFNYHINLI